MLLFYSLKEHTTCINLNHFYVIFTLQQRNVFSSLFVILFYICGIEINLIPKATEL